MTSFAQAAHAAAPAAPAFNDAFFATAATIIPVLFLAIAVQGRTYQGLLQALRRARQRPRLPGPLRRQSRTFAAYFVLHALGLLILLAGADGEIEAVLALYSRQSDVGSIVLQAVIILTIVTAAGPVIAFWRADTGQPLETGKPDAEK